MRAIVLCLAGLFFAAATGGAQALCIRSSDIDHTERPNDKTLMFYMRDHSVYRNDLPVRCPNLKVAVDGFTYEPTDPATDELCDSLVVIRLNDVGRASCILGNFTKLG